MLRFDKYVGILLLVVLCSIFKSHAQTIWTGPKIIFQKNDYADWSLPENQDRITDSVWLTRQDNQGIFNIQLEAAFDRSDRISPKGTAWANGKIADGIENLTFTTWQQSKEDASAEEVGLDKVLHLIAEDIYMDIKFLSWTAGGGGSGTGFGGGFSYERSTPLLSSHNNHFQQATLQIIPSHNWLTIKCEDQIRQVTVYTMTGALLLKTNLSNPMTEYQFSTADFPVGIYVVLVNEKYSARFVRN